MSRTRQAIVALLSGLAFLLIAPPGPASATDRDELPPPIVQCFDDRCEFHTPDGVVHDGYRYQNSKTSPETGSVGWWDHVSYLPPSTYFTAQLCNGTIPYDDSECGPWASVDLVPPPPSSVPEIIRQAFAAVGASPATQNFAVQVARCESGLNPGATNGQYLGLFQMGRYHYWRFGGRPWSDPSVNAGAAAALWAEAGWGPWECA